MKQQEYNIEHLKASIEELISEYEQAHSLLNEQMQAVIRQDIVSLNDLVEKQVEMYENLTRAEHKFKNHLQAFHLLSNCNQKLTLQNVLANIDEPTDTLNALREKLHSQVEKTERLRQQLINLLNFAQDQNAGVFEAICTFASKSSDAYNAKGKKKVQQTHGLAINQQA